ncbi:hypothetical protein G6F56_011562 [Rhizopus delemar]|nr:hypothetical protein G6F56_011562 [Rhizopus delemar]
MEEETAVDSTLETPTKKNPYELHDKIRQMKGPEADAYRKSVVDAMYSDRSATAINADCTPRDQHPLRKGSSLGLPLPTTSPDLSAISYICQGVTLPGKFNKNAAIALGIRPGPLYGRLHKGESVTLEDGRVVTPDMVCEPAKPGHLFLLIDCPSLEHMDSLVLSDQFKDYQAGGANQPNVIFHFVDRQVLEAEKYKTWLARFGKETEHVFSAIDLCPQDVQFTSHALCQVKLAKLNDEIFRVPYYQNQAELALEDVEGLPEKSFALKSLATYSLEPKREWQYLDRPAFDHTNMELEEIKAVENNKEYLEAAALAREEASQVDISGQFPGDDVQVITLGTGSSIPAKYRNGKK